MKAKKSSCRKGFTIVELVIVIGVIGILSAVLIPTFIALNAKANKAADESLIKNINTVLTMARAEEGPNQTMHDALEDALEGGFKVENLTPRSGQDIVWNSETDQFEQMEEAPATPTEKYFKIYNSIAEMKAENKYSAYLNSNENYEGVLEISMGFDAGNNQRIQDIEYRNDSGTKRNVKIRTNMGNLLVDGALDTVSHYGTGKVLTIEKVAMTDCYHEYGVFGEAEIQAGKLIVEEPGFVGALADTGTAEKAIEVNGTVLDTAEVETEITGGGNTGDVKTLNVGTFDQLQGLAFACNIGTTFEGYTIRLTDDIDMTGKVWVPFGMYIEKPTSNSNTIVLKESKFFMGSIDGNHKRIINLSNEGYRTEYTHKSVSGSVGANYGLIAFATGNISIKDLDITFRLVDAVGEQPLNCVGLVGHYFPQETVPIVKQVYNESTASWEVFDNERFDRANKVYTMKEATVSFQNVKTHGEVYAVDGAGGFIGTNYVTAHPQVMDDTGYNEWRSVKWAYQGASGKANADINWARSFALSENGSGWFAEPMIQNNADNYEVHFKPEGSEDTLVYSSGNCISYAPLHVTYQFTNCENNAEIHATSKRAGGFFGKISNGNGLANLVTLRFVDCVNSGEIFSADEKAGVLTGYYSSGVITPGSDAGITDTAKVYRNYGGIEQVVLNPGDDGILYP